jgi:hypothetical protein
VTLEYSYLPCRFCVGKSHCEQCAEEICEHLRPLRGVLSARGEIQKDKKLLHVELSSDADENLIYDTLEEVGVFV